VPPDSEEVVSVKMVPHFEVLFCRIRAKCQGILSVRRFCGGSECIALILPNTVHRRKELHGKAGKGFDGLNA